MPFTALITANSGQWHDGTGTVTYSFMHRVPNYYPQINYNGSGGNDAQRILDMNAATVDEIVPIGADVSLSDAQRAAAEHAVQVWNDVARINAVPSGAGGGGEPGTPVTGNGTLMGGLGGDAGFGENLVPRGDDAPNPSVDIRSVFANGLNFFGTTYNSLFVNINGSVSFGAPVGAYTPTTITGGGTPLIAPFWSDVDSRLDTTEPIQNPPQVIYDLDTARNIFTVTWPGVDYFNVTRSTHQPKANYFQLQLYDRGGGGAGLGHDFDMVFRYQGMQWTTGDASGGSNGLGGTPAHGGWTAGNALNFEELPQSGNQAGLLALPTTPGNTNVNGLWVFKVRNGQVISGDIAFGAWAAFSTDGTDGSGTAGAPPSAVPGAPVLSDYPGAQAQTSLLGQVAQRVPALPHTVLGTPSPHGDVWVNNSRADLSNPVLGRSGYFTFIHEYGHAIGLRHPNERTDEAEYHHGNTVMAYNPHPSQAGLTIENQDQPITPMLFDIQAAQQLYGPNLTTRTGNDTYFGPAVAGSTARYPLANHGRMIMTIWDAGGIDTISAANQTNPVRIDLNPEAYSTIGSVGDNNIAIAALVPGNPNYIENAVGGSSFDWLTGNDIGNDIRAGLGADTIDGGGGNDTLLGEAGADDIFGDAGDDTISGGDDADRIQGGPGLDTINGGTGDDIVSGGEDADVITDLGGNDSLSGDSGADTINGGTGDDTVSGGEDADLIVDPSGANLLSGDGGADRIVGGSDSDTINGNAGDDLLSGGLGNDVVSGGNDNDLINDAGGADSLSGDSGNDTISGGTGADTLSGGGDNDTLFGGADNDIIDGDGGQDLVVGEAGADTLSGGGGADTLDGGVGVDSMAGGDGNDTFFVDTLGDLATELPSEGVDLVFSSVNFTLGQDLENLTLIGAALIGTGNNIANVITGNGLANTLSGLGGVDTLMGDAGNDTLDGGIGVDSMVGGGGNDRYFVDAAGDATVEVPGAGIDQVFSSVNHALRANVENLALVGGAVIGIGNGLSNLITGNGLGNSLDGGLSDDFLYGDAGNDTLVGGESRDLMNGGLGNDSYAVDSVGDVVQEAENEGLDGVTSSINYTLAPNVENLQLVGQALFGTGNPLNNLIIGNALNNTLNGMGGADTLFGRAGNDIYFVDQPADAVVESVGEGTDRVLTSVNYVLRPGSEIETLTTTNAAGAQPINLVGNEFANAIVGNAGANVLDGRGGADNLQGLGGNDSYFVDNAADLVLESANRGNDRVFTSVSYALRAGSAVETLTTTASTGASPINLTGNELSNSIVGNEGVNVLNGGAGADIMQGLGGHDAYIVDHVGDLVLEAANAGTDQVLASISYALAAGSHVETLATANAAGTGAINLTGNERANVLLGNAGANVLDGRGGADVMRGLAGDDVHRVDNAADLAIESPGQGNDRVIASVNYALGAGSAIEFLETDSPGSNLSRVLTGNEFANTITGDAGNNVIDGRGGDDVMVGLGGNDRYAVDSAGDQVVEGPGAGTFDSVLASVSWVQTPGSHLALVATNDDDGTAAINLTGNALNNSLRGNAGNNILNGGLGADDLVGLAGDDTYFVDTQLDETREQINGGFDRVFTTVSYQLYATFSIELLACANVAGTQAINLTGNEFDNTLIGNAGVNVLDGLFGSDTLIGLGGNDVYEVARATARAVEAVGGGIDRVIVDPTFLGGSYALSAGQEVEIVMSTNPASTSTLNLTGNEFANTLIGNAAGNILNGGGGADVLRGLQGNDMVLVDNAADVVLELAGEGLDRVLASVSYALGGGSEVETLSTSNTAATGAINLSGNEFGNTIVGNAGVNVLRGMAGADILFGLQGNDLLQGGAGNDQLWGGDGLDWADYSDQTQSVSVNLGSQAGSGAGAGMDSFNAVENARGGAGQDVIWGSAGNNLIEGGGGRDILYGLAGADTFIYRAVADSRLSSGYDTLADFVSGTDKLDLSAFGITAANVSIQSSASATSLYANVDGVAGFGVDDLAIAFTDAGAIAMGDILF